MCHIFIRIKCIAKSTETFYKTICVRHRVKTVWQLFRSKANIFINVPRLFRKMNTRGLSEDEKLVNFHHMQTERRPSITGFTPPWFSGQQIWSESTASKEAPI